jgi:phage anti-repressor protein
MKIIKELIRVTEKDNRQVVSARELHIFLESNQDFSTWIKDRIERYDFIENDDYWVFHKIIENPTGGRPRIEYILTIECAKELCMVENNEKGKQARKYFLEIEKRFYQGISGLTQPQPTMTKEELNFKKAEFLERIAQCYETRNPTYQEILHSYASKLLFGEHVLPLPKVIRKTYTATEVGKQLNISSNLVGRLVSQLGLKVSLGQSNEYGEWYIDKSQYSNKEVNTWRYTEEAIPKIKMALIAYLDSKRKK